MKKSYQVGAPVPESIGRCADLYKEVRDLRLAMEKQVAPIKARENEIKEHIISNLDKSDDTGASGLRYRAQIKQKDVPVVKDWPALWGWIFATERTDCLQKRVAEKAIMETLENGEVVPGIEVAHIPDVSITKI